MGRVVDQELVRVEDGGLEVDKTGDGAMATGGIGGMRNDGGGEEGGREGGGVVGGGGAEGALVGGGAEVSAAISGGRLALLVVVVVALGVDGGPELGGRGDELVHDRLQVRIHPSRPAMLVRPHHRRQQRHVRGRVLPRMVRPHPTRGPCRRTHLLASRRRVRFRRRHGLNRHPRTRARRGYPPRLY